MNVHRRCEKYYTLNNKLFGSYYRYYSEGVLFSKAYYIDGMRHGEYTEYHDGKIILQEYYYFGKHHGHERRNNTYSYS